MHVHVLEKEKPWKVTSHNIIRLKDRLPHLWSPSKTILQGGSPRHHHRRPLRPDRHHRRQQQDEDESTEECFLFHDKGGQGR